MKIVKDFIDEYKLLGKKLKEKKLKQAPPDEWKKGTKGDVVLVPGFNESWVFQKTLGNFLNNKGYRIHTVSSVEHNTHTIEYCVKEIKNYIANKNLMTVILLAHSKGGVIVRALLADPEIERRVKKAFTIAVPHKGTLWGYAKFKNLHELSYKSKILKTLPAGSKKTINIYSKIDQHVIPNKNLFLEGAINEPVHIVGHTRILESLETQKIIEKYLP